MALITITRKLACDTPEQAITLMFKNNLSKCEDAGDGMYNFYLDLMGMYAIAQAYVRGDNEGQAYMIVCDNNPEGSYQDTFRIKELPESLQWGIAIQIAEKMGFYIDTPYNIQG